MFEWVRGERQGMLIRYRDPHVGVLLFSIEGETLIFHSWGKRWVFERKYRNGQQTVFVFAYDDSLREHVLPADFEESVFSFATSA